MTKHTESVVGAAHPTVDESVVGAAHTHTASSLESRSAAAVDRTESTRFVFSKEVMKCVCTEQF